MNGIQLDQLIEGQYYWVYNLGLVDRLAPYCFRRTAHDVPYLCRGNEHLDLYLWDSATHDWLGGGDCFIVAHIERPAAINPIETKAIE